MPPKPFEIYRRLLREGWQDNGCKGYHRKLSKDGKRVTVPLHRKELAKSTWERIRKDAGWR